jgi:cytochrome c oxidase subunit 2
MAFVVVVDPADEFAEWYENQLRPAPIPSDPNQLKGQEVFLKSRCVMCHSIRGTTAAASVAPDLTHIGSRQTIAAGTLPNTASHLGDWILDSQSVKPGNKMPPNELSAEDLEALLAYLETLK